MAPDRSNADCTRLRVSTRAAHAGISGYHYQFAYTALRWWQCKPGQVLYCEGNEDLDQVFKDGSVEELRIVGDHLKPPEFEQPGGDATGDGDGFQRLHPTKTSHGQADPVSTRGAYVPRARARIARPQRAAAPKASTLAA